MVAIRFQVSSGNPIQAFQNSIPSTAMLECVMQLSSISRNSVVFAAGTTAGVFGCYAIKWLREEPVSASALYIINHSENQPETKAVTLAEFNRQITTDDLNKLRESVGWGVRSREIWQGILKESTEVVCIKENSQLIGFGCFVGNSRMGTIFDVVIHKNHQKKQYGTLLMNHLVKGIKSRNYATIGLFGWDENPTVVDFYKKFGFESVALGMDSSPNRLHTYDK